MTDTEVRFNDDRSRFETTVDGHVAFLDSAIDGDRITLVHTEVPSELGGRGVGTDIVRFALTYAKEHGLAVVPQCPFVRSYLERHPEAADGLTIVDPD